jgi:hypothetical protein
MQLVSIESFTHLLYCFTMGLYYLFYKIIALKLGDADKKAAL